MANAIVTRVSKAGRIVQFKGRTCQASWVSNRPQGSACDKGSCGKEPDECESLTSGSEAGGEGRDSLAYCNQPTPLTVRV
jgi:hypothetical protein